MIHCDYGTLEDLVHAALRRECGFSTCGNSMLIVRSGSVLVDLSSRAFSYGYILADKGISVATTC